MGEMSTGRLFPVAVAAALMTRLTTLELAWLWMEQEAREFAVTLRR